MHAFVECRMAHKLTHIWRLYRSVCQRSCMLDASAMQTPNICWLIRHQRFFFSLIQLGFQVKCPQDNSATQLMTTVKYIQHCINQCVFVPLYSAMLAPYSQSRILTKTTADPDHNSGVFSNTALTYRWRWSIRCMPCVTSCRHINKILSPRKS